MLPAIDSPSHCHLMALPHSVFVVLVAAYYPRLKLNPLHSQVVGLQL